MKKPKTSLELKQQKKRELEADLDYLKQVDQPQGRKFVSDVRKAEQKKEKTIEDNYKSNLEYDRQRSSYYDRLAQWGAKRLAEADIESGWAYGCMHTKRGDVILWDKKFKAEDGVLVAIRSPQGTIYSRGINLTFDPEYDLNAINMLVMQAENTIEAQKNPQIDGKDTKGVLKQTKGGIWVPDE